MTGKELQKAIIHLARLRGWKVAHFPTIQDARGTWRTPVAADGKGFPDLLLVKDRIVIAEIKGKGDRVREDQEDWITRFRIANVETYVWQPGHWTDGTIDAIL